MAPSGHVVLTGVSGFLGRHVALALLRQGYDVTGTTRTLKSADEARRAIFAMDGAANGRLTTVLADLENNSGWDAAMQGGGILVHTASPFPAGAPKDESLLMRPALEGTRRVLEAAARCGISRVVLTSSIAAVSYGPGRAPFTETDWTDIDGPLATAYYKSKTLAERAAWDLAGQRGLDLTVFNPGMILGPMIGLTPGTSVAIVRKILKGAYPAMPKFCVPMVDVRDVADAHVTALSTPKASGERFLLAGKTVSVADIVAELRLAMPSHARRLPRVTLPNWVARLAVPFDAGMAMIVNELGRDNSVSHEKAARLLGWRPRPESETIRETAESLVAAGLV